MKKGEPLIVGNWKSFVTTPKEALSLVKSIDKGLPRKLFAKLVVCPSMPLLALIRHVYKGKRIALGVQDVSVETAGAHTGESSATLIKSSGADFAIVGHAEMRAKGESSLETAIKARAALDAKITPIVCVGESERDREGKYFASLESMLQESMKLVTQDEVQRVVVAYEPVWAIGAAQPPDPRTISEAVLYLKKTLVALYGRDKALKVRIIYGGAVEQNTAREILQSGHVSGFLVGRASVDHHNFLGIIRACQ